MIYNKKERLGEKTLVIYISDKCDIHKTKMKLLAQRFKCQTVVRIVCQRKEAALCMLLTTAELDNSTASLQSRMEGQLLSIFP